MKKIYYVTGVSGTGKSTIAKELNKRGIFAIDQDSICNWKNNDTKEYSKFKFGIGTEFLENNDWYCDIDKLKKALEKEEAIVFVCGSSANHDEYIDMFEKVFFLKCAPEVFLKRINERIDHDFGKHESESEHILGYYKEYEKDLVSKGAIIIDADKPIEQVLEDILNNL